jgi:ketosteroid isomerase-like protein
MFVGEFEPMTNVWAQDTDVVLMGPFGGRQVGWLDVSSLLRRDAEAKQGGQVTPRDVLLRLGRELAYSVCIERGEVIAKGGRRVPVDLRATNILRREGDEWRLIYHHTDPLLGLQEVSGFKSDDFAALARETPDAEILKVMDRYDAAMRSMFGGDVGPLGDVWARTDDVTLVSPVGNIQVGWHAVRGEYERHAGQNVRGSLQLKSPLIRVYDDLAYVSWLAAAPDLTIDGKPYVFNLRATTILRRESSFLRRLGGAWRVVHQHTDFGPGLAELCGLASKQV